MTFVVGEPRRREHGNLLIAVLDGSTTATNLDVPIAGKRTTESEDVLSHWIDGRLEQTNSRTHSAVMSNPIDTHFYPVRCCVYAHSEAYISKVRAFCCPVLGR